MEPTVRVSIAGMAFTLEQDAYRLVQDYLETLKKHFSNKPDADEIISDIESRMSELIGMRRNAQNVVTLGDVQEIISIMGNPKDFGDENPNIEYSKGQEEDKSFFDALRKKKLYRDVDNKILGGVFSGLGHYFRIDPVVFRLVFTLLMFLPMFFSAIFDLQWFHFTLSKVSWAIFLLYIVLWAIMPKARSFRDKVVMKGANASIEDIENRTSTVTSNKYRGSAFRNIINVIFNLIVIAMAIVTCVALIGVVVVFVFSLVGGKAWELDNFLSVVGFDSSLDLKIMIFLACILPLIGICFLAFKILKRSRFTSGDFIISLIAFLGWIGVGAYLFSEGVTYFKEYKVRMSDTQVIPVAIQSDVLYLRVENQYLDGEEVFNSEDLFFLNGDKQNIQLFTLPHIKTQVDTSLTTIKIEVHKNAYGRSRAVAAKAAKKASLSYVLTDSLLTISPHLYNKDQPWHGETFDLTIYVPAGKKVKLEQSMKDIFWRYSYFKEDND